MITSVLWLLGGVGVAGLVSRLKKKSAASTPPVVQSALAQAPSAPGVVTPARAAIHGDLMARCTDPKKLQRAAALFGHEGLPQHAQTLLQKASELHQMMHGARDIVERSRQGDQHAMALAKSIGDQARAGNPRAVTSAFLIQEYTKKHPNGAAPTSTPTPAVDPKAAA